MVLFVALIFLSVYLGNPFWMIYKGVTIGLQHDRRLELRFVKRLCFTNKYKKKEEKNVYLEGICYIVTSNFNAADRKLLMPDLKNRQ